MNPDAAHLAAWAEFDRLNSQDPNFETVEGKQRPRELVYAERLSSWVLRLNPNASLPLRLAARCQHLRRWEVPRASYPMTRAGYLRWREDLRHFHAQKSGEVLGALGYDPSIVTRVRELNLKQRFPEDPEVCTLEDALCLVFLEHQLEPLALRTPEPKMLAAIRKAWGKMSDRARGSALGLTLSETTRELLRKALGEGFLRSDSARESACKERAAGL